MHFRCLSKCQANPRSRSASMRRRALRLPAASLRLAGVRAVRSPPRPTPGRQAKPDTGPRGRGRWRDVRRAAPGYGGATAPSTDRWRGEPGPCAGVRSTLASACPNLQQDTIHGTKAGLQDFRAARDATSRAGASCVSTAWSWPRRNGVRPARTHAIIPSLTKQNLGSTAGRPEPRARRVASSRHGGASRGFPSAQHNGVRRDARTRSARPPAWGSRGATPPLLNPLQPRDHVALRTATAALKSTHGPGAPSVAARQFCGSMASTQARNQQRASQH
jgi:hypothetical protein